MYYHHEPRSLYDRGWEAGYDGREFPNLGDLTPAQKRELRAGYHEGLYDQCDAALRHFQRTKR